MWGPRVESQEASKTKSTPKTESRYTGKNIEFPWIFTSTLLTRPSTVRAWPSRTNTLKSGIGSTGSFKQWVIRGCRKLLELPLSSSTWTCTPLINPLNLMVPKPEAPFNALYEKWGSIKTWDFRVGFGSLGLGSCALSNSSLQLAISDIAYLDIYVREWTCHHM